MSEGKHDVLADPLTPYWRQLVDEAFDRDAEHQVRQRDAQPNAEELKFLRLWRAGVPLYAIRSAFLGVGPYSVDRIGDRLRTRGLLLPHRPRGWKPPNGWRSRLDSILKGGG